jgi:hypothetical protein
VLRAIDMLKKEYKLMFDTAVLLAEEGKVLAICPCGAYLDPQELYALKCKTCGNDIDFEKVMLRSITTIAKA